MLMFALILDKKFKQYNINAIALSAHPGFTKSNLRTRRLKTEPTMKNFKKNSGLYLKN
jgi:hypothetical protein